MEENKEKFLVIDGNSIMNRAFYGIKLLSTKDGLYTNAIYGFLNIYYMILDKLTPDYVAVAFDLKSPTFRHEMFVDYKAHRKMMPDELKVQMPVIKDILRAMNIPIFEIEGFEADDVLGTIATRNEEKNIFTYILTGDKDSLQLISESTNIVMPQTRMGKTEYTIYTPEVLMEKQGIVPKQVIDIKALMGDASDNIPGVPGIGEKTAYSLIGKYSSLKNIYESLANIECTPSVKRKLTENKDIAFLSYTLATIDVNVPIELDYEALKLTEADVPKLTSIFERLSFKKLLERYNVDGSIIPETDNNVEFFKDFDRNNIIDISNNIELFNSYINQIPMSDSEKLDNIYLTIINSKNMELKDVLAINYKNRYMYIYLSSPNIVNVLNTLVKVPNDKIGYDIKNIYKLCIKNSVNDFSSFKSDIKIAYYLLHSSENNYEIENISYNLLNVNMPLENTKNNVEEKPKEVQTSLFDTAFGIETENKETIILTLSEIQEKYIYSVLKTIKEVEPLLLSKIEELKMSKLYYDIEMPLIETLANIENNGMYINKDKLINFGKNLSYEIMKLEEKIYSIAGETFNIGSTVKLGKILFEKLQLPVVKKTKNGYSTDKETLEELEDKHEIIKYILDYRAMTKLKSTYVEGLLSTIADDNRIHTTFMQTVTATGRLSSIDPNLQNIPVRTELGGKIRDCFEAEGDNIIIDADYSQIELRVLAHMSNDDIMIQAFKDGKDIHTITASQVFDIPVDEVTSELRTKAKAVNFGIVYGISGFGLAKNINSSRAEATEYINNYLAKYSKVKAFMDKSVKSGKEKGFVSTLFGRIRYTDELKASNRNTIMFGERIAMNTPIQGTAADIMKKAMNTLYAKMKKKNLKSKIIMQVHDELLVEAVPEEKDIIIKLMEKSMQNVIKLKVPLDVTINVGKTWSEAK